MSLFNPYCCRAQSTMSSANVEHFVSIPYRSTPKLQLRSLINSSFINIWHKCIDMGAPWCTPLRAIHKGPVSQLPATHTQSPCRHHISSSTLCCSSQLYIAYTGVHRPILYQKLSGIEKGHVCGFAFDAIVSYGFLKNQWRMQAWTLHLPSPLDIFYDTLSAKLCFLSTSSITL